MKTHKFYKALYPSGHMQRGFSKYTSYGNYRKNLKSVIIL